MGSPFGGGRVRYWNGRVAPRSPWYRPLGEPAAAPLWSGGPPFDPGAASWEPPSGARLRCAGRVGGVRAAAGHPLDLPAALALPPK